MFHFLGGFLSKSKQGDVIGGLNHWHLAGGFGLLFNPLHFLVMVSLAEATCQDSDYAMAIPWHLKGFAVHNTVTAMCVCPSTRH